MGRSLPHDVQSARAGRHDQHRHPQASRNRSRAAAGLIVLLFAAAAAAQESIDDALKQHSYGLRMDGGALRGPGADFLLQQSAGSQFVVFGEEHGVKEFPEFLSALFSQLHQRFGFNYVAVESDPVSAHVVSIRPLRGDFDAIAGYARKYPNAFTFATDQELRMFADAGRISTGKVDAVWGLDQSFGVLHALDRLQELPGFHRMPQFDALYEQASRAPEGSEARFILDNLVSSSQIYGYYHAHAGYLNGYVREQQMKQLFMREYRLAQSRGERLPKVLLKLGHWHVFRGVGPSRLQTLGNFVSEFATANGSEAFVIGIYLRGPWRDVASQKGLEPIAAATDPAQWTVIDFRALRLSVSSSKFGKLDPNLVMHLYGFDAALVIGAASPGTDSSIR